MQTCSSVTLLFLLQKTKLDMIAVENVFSQQESIKLNSLPSSYPMHSMLLVVVTTEGGRSLLANKLRRRDNHH